MSHTHIYIYTHASWLKDTTEKPCYAGVERVRLDSDSYQTHWITLLITRQKGYERAMGATPASNLWSKSISESQESMGCSVGQFIAHAHTVWLYNWLKLAQRATGVPTLMHNSWSVPGLHWNTPYDNLPSVLGDVQREECRETGLFSCGAQWPVHLLHRKTN